MFVTRGRESLADAKMRSAGLANAARELRIVVSTPGTFPARASSGMNGLRENGRNRTTRGLGHPRLGSEVLAQYTKHATNVKNFPSRFSPTGRTNCRKSSPLRSSICRLLAVRPMTFIWIGRTSAGLSAEV